MNSNHKIFVDPLIWFPNKNYQYKNSTFYHFENIPLDNLLDLTPLIVLGEPGSGKSRLIEELGKKYQNLGNEIIKINIKEFDEKNATIFEILQSENPNLPGSTILLFDAVDEVSGSIFEKRISELTEFKDKKIIVTCRSNFVDNINNKGFLKDFNLVELQELDSKRISKFLKLYCNYFSSKSEQAIWEELLSLNIVTSKFHYQHSPSILTIPRYLLFYCELIENEDDLKYFSNKSLLFEKIIDKRLDVEFDKMRKRLQIKYFILRVLEDLALLMKMGGKSHVLEEDFYTFIIDFYPSLLSQIEIETIFSSTIIKKNKIVNNSKVSEIIEFDNIEFIEYLAAKSIVKLGDASQILFDIAFNHNINKIYSSWQNTISYINEIDLKILEYIIDFSFRHKYYEGFEFLQLLSISTIENELKKKFGDGFFIKIIKYFNKNQFILWEELIKKVALFFEYNNNFKILTDCDEIKFNYVAFSNTIKVLSHLSDNNKIPEIEYSSLKTLLSEVYNRDDLKETDDIGSLFNCISCIYNFSGFYSKIMQYKNKSKAFYYVINKILKTKYPNHKRSIEFSLKNLNSRKHTSYFYNLNFITSDKGFKNLFELIIFDNHIRRSISNLSEDDFDDFFSKLHKLKKLNSLNNLILDSIFYLAENTNYCPFLNSLVKFYLSIFQDQYENLIIKIHNTKKKTTAYKIKELIGFNIDFDNYGLIFSICNKLDLSSISYDIGFHSNDTNFILNFFPKKFKELRNTANQNQKTIDGINTHRDIEEKNRLENNYSYYLEKLEINDPFDCVNFLSYHFEIFDLLKPDEIIKTKALLFEYLEKLSVLSIFRNDYFADKSIVIPLKIIKEKNDTLNIDLENLKRKFRQKIILGRISFIIDDEKLFNYFISEINENDILELINLYLEHKSKIKEIPVDLIDQIKEKNMIQFIPMIKEIAKNLQFDSVANEYAFKALFDFKEYDFLQKLFENISTSYVIDYSLKRELNKITIQTEHLFSFKWRTSEILKNKYLLKYNHDGLRGVGHEEKIGEELLGFSFPVYESEVLALLEQSFQILANDIDYYRFVYHEIWIMTATYFKNRFDWKEKFGLYINLLYDVYDKNKHSKNAYLFQNLISSVENEILSNYPISFNFYQIIREFKLLKDKKYLDIKSNNDLFNKLVFIIDTELRTRVFHGSYRVIQYLQKAETDNKLNKGNIKREVIIQDLFEKDLKNLLLENQFRSLDIIREPETQDDDKIDFQINYGHIGSVLIEIKRIEDNRLNDAETYIEKMLHYMKGLNVNHCILLILRDNCKCSIEDYLTKVDKVKHCMKSNYNFEVIGIDLLEGFKEMSQI